MSLFPKVSQKIVVQKLLLSPKDLRLFVRYLNELEVRERAVTSWIVYERKGAHRSLGGANVTFTCDAFGNTRKSEV